MSLHYSYTVNCKGLFSCIYLTPLHEQTPPNFLDRNKQQLLEALQLPQKHLKLHLCVRNHRYDLFLFYWICIKAFNRPTHRFPER